MERKHYYAYNKTRESFLSLGVTYVDRVSRSFWSTLAKRELKTNEGIWLASSSLRRDAGCNGQCDRIYLDSGLCVAALEEGVPGAPLNTASKSFESVLLLPMHTIFGSQTQLGDQVLIGTIEDIGAILNGIEPLAGEPSVQGRTQERKRRQAPMNWLARLFSARERRRSKRHFSPPLMAFYWDGGIPVPHNVPDISKTGLFVKTADRWFPRTLLRVTLQKQSTDPERSDETITVQCRVVRTGEDGVGMAFMLAEDARDELGASVGALATRKELNQFFEHLVSDVTGVPFADHPFLPFPELAQANDGGKSAELPAEPADSKSAPERDGRVN